MTAALIGFAALFALLVFGVPIGYAMGLIGFVGFAITVGTAPAASMVAQIAFDNSITYAFSVLPLFMLMGALFAHARMADELYAASYAFLGHRRGGLAMATILACGGFSAVSGSSLACAATMAKVSVPLMRQYDYAPGFAAASVAVGATLDILIPPSITMVIYAFLTNVDLGKLMIAGVLPGLLMIGCYLVVIVAITGAWPHLGPSGPRTPWRGRLEALREVWAMIVLFTVSLGGIYVGVFTPTEAAGIGALGAFAIALLRGRLQARPTLHLLLETARITSTIFIVVIGALLFSNFLTVSGAAGALQDWVRSLELAPGALIVALLGIYLVLGCVLDASAMTLLTVPVFFPIVVQAGIDPLWFGIFVIIVVGIGMIHPPLGMLLFIVRKFVPDVTPGAIFRGVAPFLVGEAVCLALLILFPAIVLVLPRMMR
jgi:tripartite ATP-independent transporter DctM subunit